MMMFEEFQDGCLVLGNLWYANGMILATSESQWCIEPSIKFLLSRGYMFWKNMLVGEFKDGCLVLGNLWCVNGMILAFSESPCCWKPSIKFVLKKIYGLEEDVGWRISRWLFSAWPFLICDWDDFSFSESPSCLIHPIKFLLETIFGLEDVVWIKYKEGCSVLGHLWFVNGMILFILSLHVVWCIPISLCWREYMGWKKLFKNSTKAVLCMTIFCI